MGPQNAEHIPINSVIIHFRILPPENIRSSSLQSAMNLNLLPLKPPIQIPDLTLYFKQSANRTQEVTVSANREEKASQYTNTMTLSTEFLKQMPAIGGEVDVFRVLQLMPGVKSVGELSSGLYVRGGSPDQNLTLLDGVIVYNPSHLGGFLSTFNSDALKDINLLKGGFPAEYGGRLSSVLDMTMREGTKEKSPAKVEYH